MNTPKSFKPYQYVKTRGLMPEKIYLGYMYVNLFPVHAIVTAGRVGGYLLNKPSERSKGVSTLNPITSLKPKVGREK